MENSTQRIQNILDDIVFLQNLKEEVDPASCMSIAVRRGVPRNNPDDDHDEENRPWRSMSFVGSLGKCNGMYFLIDMLIEDRNASLQLAINQTDKEVIDQKIAIEKARLFLEKHNGK
jgi:hypothetical protein